MDGAAAVGRWRVRAGEHVDAFAALLGIVRPDTFGDHDAQPQPIEEFRVQHNLVTLVADLDTVAFGGILE